jgi:hypothetical protein
MFQMIRRSLALAAVALTLGLATPAIAQEATPSVAGEADITMVLVEHADEVTNIDQGDEGSSAGDQIIWGPNALYDEANATDTGATTQGICTAISSGDCVLIETIVFPDGSTLELQGVQPGEPTASTRTIVGGSGQYLGAHGTVTVEPTDDLQYWSKTIEIWLAD